MTANRQARILGAIQTMKVMARANAQRLSAEVLELQKKRDAKIFCISDNRVTGQAFVAQMEKSLTNISVELQALVSKKDQSIRESIKLMEQERIAEERLRSVQGEERRRQDDSDCLDWISRQVVGGRKPGTGL